MRPLRYARRLHARGRSPRIFARTVNIEATFEAFPICEDFVP